MKKYFATFLSALMALSLAACGTDTSAGEPAEAPGEGGEATAEAAAPEAADVNAAYDAEKGLTSMQSDVGFYANVYAGQTLKGTWKLDEIKKEAEEIEE